MSANGTMSSEHNESMKTISETADWLAEIIGEESLEGKKMQAGAILDLMDICAGRIAYKHSKSYVATVAVDEVSMIQPVFHQDLIRIDGKIVWVGSSSMMVKLEAYRQNQSRGFQLVQVSFFTMVAIDATGKPKKNIPGLLYQSKEEEDLREEALKRKELSDKWLQKQKDVDSLVNIHFEEHEDEENKKKSEYLTIKASEMKVRRLFFPKHVNLSNTIFGGEILLWMDRVATQCARTFTRDKNMITVAMNRVFFKQPIFTTDWVEMTARVVYVTKFSLEVEIEVKLERKDGSKVKSHSGYFTLVNEYQGSTHEILTGLKIENEDQESLKRYLKAKERLQFWKQHNNVSQFRIFYQ